MKTKKFICGNCKQEVNDTQKFCTGCGAELKLMDAVGKPFKYKNAVGINVNIHGVDTTDKEVEAGLQQLAKEVVDYLWALLKKTEFRAKSMDIVLEKMKEV